MKIIILCVCIISTFALKAQDRTNFATDQFVVVREKIGNETLPNLEENPYMAVSVLFRGESNLSNKNFIGYFNKMQFFYTEVVIDYANRNGQVKKEISPLYLLKCEKGVFSTKVFKDKTVILKLPVSKYSAKMPSVTLNTKITLENQAIKVIKYISEKVKPLVDNPTSVFGPAALSYAYGFFNDVIVQLNDTKTVNSEVGFEAFSPEKLDILPLEYRVVILKPDIATVKPDGFLIKKDASDGKLKLYQGDSIYNKYPHFIIEIGLSNYLDADGMPLNFYKTKGSCSISGSELNALQSNFETNKIQLSNTQEPAEYNLLNLYQYKMSIDEGVAGQGALDEGKLLKAYNAMYSYYKTKSEIDLEPKLYASKYKTVYEKFTSEKEGSEGCLIKSIQSLAFAPIVTQIFPILEKKPQNVTNDELARLKTYIEATRSLAYITKSSFNANAVVLISLIETETYTKHFADIIKEITVANAVTDDISSKMKTLTGLRAKFDNCTLCQTESEKASKHFNVLVNDLNSLRGNMNFVITAANDAVAKANTTIQKGDLLLAANIQPPVDVPTITKEQEDIVLNRNKLSEFLATITISAANKTTIQILIDKIQQSAKLINDYESKTSIFFEEKKGLLNKAN